MGAEMEGLARTCFPGEQGELQAQSLWLWGTWRWSAALQGPVSVGVIWEVGPQSSHLFCLCRSEV